MPTLLSDWTIPEVRRYRTSAPPNLLLLLICSRVRNGACMFDALNHGEIKLPHSAGGPLWPLLKTGLGAQTSAAPLYIRHRERVIDICKRRLMKGIRLHMDLTFNNKTAD